MESRRLGRSGLEIAPLVLGGNVFGWSADKATSFAILDAFVAAGFNAIDTADVYSIWVHGHVGGESETIIGEWIASRGGRDRVLLASKVGAKSGLGEGLSAAHIERSAEASLKRLRTDYIDLYQSHHDDMATPLDETLEAYGRLVATGKVRAIGASHFTADRLAEAASNAGRTHYVSFQTRYNLCDRAEFEGAVQQACLDTNLGVLAYSALAKGFLTGKFRTDADRAPIIWKDRLHAYGDDRGLKILSALDEVAEAHGARPAEVALAWVVAQPGVVAAIAAVDNVAQLTEFADFTRLALTPNQLAALSAAGAS